MYITNARPGQNPFREQKMRVVNRCGATALKVGDLVALDVDASDTATQNLQGVGGSVATLTEAMFHNVVDVAAAPLNALVAVVTDLLGGAGADDTVVEIQVSGPVKAKVGGTDWSTARSSCGVALQAETAGTGTRRLIQSEATANEGKVGLILEAIDANLSASNQQQTNVLLLGFGSSVGVEGAAA